jgi:hypothetical protein
MSALMPRKKRSSRDAPAELDDGGRGSVVSIGSASPQPPRLIERPRQKVDCSASKDRDGEDKKKSSGGLGGVLKRGLSSFKHASIGGSADEKKALKEERERERMQSQSWAGTSSASRNSQWSHPSGRTQYHHNSCPPLPERKSVTPPSLGTPNFPPNSEDRLAAIAPFSLEEAGQVPSLGSGVEDETTQTWKTGKAWNGVPDEAVALVVPIENGDESRPAITSLQPVYSLLDGIRQALLVCWVPFDPNHDDQQYDDRPTTANSFASSGAPSEQSSSISSSSIPKFQRLLRRRASKDNNVMRKEKESDPSRPSTQILRSDAEATYRKYPLPCRSFRVVARVVDVDDLRSEPEGNTAGFYDQWTEQQRKPFTSANQDVARAASATASSSNPSPIHPQASLPSSSDDADAMSASTAPTSAILAGRTSPTVIAVCHSRSQGVEFVLEGLDRLGFCQGLSAWGPTGYEEFRAQGLSAKGRELIDLVWAGSTVVMGIVAA